MKKSHTPCWVDPTIPFPSPPDLISHRSVDFRLESSSSSFPLSPKSLLTTLNWRLNKGAQLPYPLRGHFWTLGFLNNWGFLWLLYDGPRYSSGQNLLPSSLRPFIIWLIPLLLQDSAQFLLITPQHLSMCSICTLIAICLLHGVVSYFRSGSWYFPLNSQNINSTAQRRSQEMFAEKKWACWRYT